MSYPLALLVTLVVEIPIMVAGLAILGWPVLGSTRSWARALLALVVNLITHPVLWWSLRDRYGHGHDLAWLAVAEVIVWMVEAALITIATRRGGRALGWAIALSGWANAASLGIGLIINAMMLS